MKKEIIDFLDTCTDKGIIDEFQKNRAIDLDKDVVKAKEVMIKNFLNLMVVLMSVFLTFAGMLVVFQKFNYVNPVVKLLVGGTLLIISLFGIAKSKIKENYFALEIFVAMNLCVTLMFIVSGNMETVFRYRSGANAFLTCMAMLPVFFVVESYITLIVCSVIFLTTGIPELNFAIITIPNAILELTLTAMYVVLLIYKFTRLYSYKEETIFSKYFSKDIVLIVLEVLILVTVFRLCYIGAGNVDIVFIYLIMCWIIIRRSSLFKGLVPIPMVLDIMIFFSTIYLFLFREPLNYEPTNVLIYHSLYYLVVLLLKQRGYLDYTPEIYKLQQHFYINLFIIVFAFSRVSNSNEMWFIITVILGLFNTFIGLRYKSAVHSIVGLSIIILTLVVTALTVPSVVGGALFIISGLVIAYINREIISEVLKDNE